MTPAAADPTSLSPPHLDVASRVITALAGEHSRFRDDQERAIAALCEPAARVLVVQATGWGKSAVYWAATAIRRHEGAGTTLVVSPLLSLMRDQVNAAAKAGLRAATLNSSNIGEWSAVEAAVRAGELDVLLVSPERLANPKFGDRVMSGLAGNLGLLVIDECHALSDWGHDFRPDYRRLSDVLQTLNPSTPVLATTATANERVTRDVAAQLGEATVVIRGQLARTSLQLVCVPPMDPLSRYAWVVDHLGTLPGSGIVYCLTVADAERLTGLLAERYGVRAVAVYTGQLDAETRAETEDRLRRNDVKAVVATSALGMGFDKADLGFVVHVGAAPSPVAYYQQIGRAGRGLDHALVVLLPSDADEPIWEYFATSTIPVEADVHTLLTTLDEAHESMSVPALEAMTSLRRGSIELMLKQLAVDRAVTRTVDGWQATGQEWVYDAAHYDAVVAGRRREAAIMRDYIAGSSCLMMLLQQSLDDPAATACGRCSVCLGALPSPLAAGADPVTVGDAKRLLRGGDHILEPRKMWPGGTFGAKGRIPTELAASEGRVLVYADAPEWRDVISAAFEGDRAGDVPQELLDGAVQTLVRWKGAWPTRPDCVVGLPAAGHTEVVKQVAGHLASVGRLPCSNWLPNRRVSERQASGGEEAAGWRDVLMPPDEVRRFVDGQAVLLLVDRTATTWPVTVAAAALREAGATAVLPMVVHRQP
ncbi:MAG: ATP-dependent DNA helicase RecQ [Propionibacteriales bacterium]|nr:ATP-dependent DNA helicase RecQ [Propionibacteriales bacterium]